MGGVEGGVWKSTDYGLTWTNITDGKIPGIADPIGALAVAPSNSNVIYAGTGEADIRSDFDTGDGVYKTTDAGKTWSYAGLRDTHMIAKIAVDPNNARIAYAASMGHVFRPNPERGIFKTTDGGNTWSKVLFVNDDTGAIDLAMDSRNRNVLYAAMWQAQRFPWKLSSGGPGSGLYKTLDGGRHWMRISSNPGFATGLLGKIGVAVAASDPRIVYAIVQAHDGGVFRSNDAGRTWKRVNAEWKLRQRAFYYMALTVDPTNPQVVYAPEVDGIYKTTDGGKTFTNIEIPHGDNHIIWINPHEPKICWLETMAAEPFRLTEAITGATIIISRQASSIMWRSTTSSHFTSSALVKMKARTKGQRGRRPGHRPGQVARGRFGREHVRRARARRPDVTYGSGYFSSIVAQPHTGDTKERQPLASLHVRRIGGGNEISLRVDASDLLLTGRSARAAVASQVVFSSMDRGQTWKILSPDLTRNDPSTEGPTGGPVDATTKPVPKPSRTFVACRFAHSMATCSGRVGRRSRARNERSRRPLETRNSAAASGWAQISSIEPSHTREGGLSYGVALQWDDYHHTCLKRPISVPLGPAHQRNSRRPVRARRSPRSARTGCSLPGPDHGVRELQRRQHNGNPSR